MCSGEVSGAKDAVEQAVFVKAASFCPPLGLVCKEGGAGQQILSAASREAWSAALRRALGPGRRQRRDCCRHGVVSAAFSSAATHLHPPPVSAPVASLWEYS